MACARMGAVVGGERKEEMRKTLVVLSALGVAACSDGTVMTLSNQTTCSFEVVEGIKVHPRTGEETVVFSMDRVDPRDDRPVYFDLDWEGTLRITADQPVGYAQEFYVSPGMGNMTIPLTGDGPLDCKLRSAEEY